MHTFYVDSLYTQFVKSWVADQTFADVVFIIGVIGILHLMVSVSFKLMVLLVPNMPAPESTIQLVCANCALFMATGAMNMDCQCKIRLPTQVYMVVYEDLGYICR